MKNQIKKDIQELLGNYNYQLKKWKDWKKKKIK